MSVADQMQVEGMSMRLTEYYGGRGTTPSTKMLQIQCETFQERQAFRKYTYMSLC